MTYVFQEIRPAEIGSNIRLVNVDENEEGDSLSAILQQKERIRSIITPDIDQRDEILLGGKHNVINNSDGRSPFNGVQLKVISLNHKKKQEWSSFPKKLSIRSW